MYTFHNPLYTLLNQQISIERISQQINYVIQFPTTVNKSLTLSSKNSHKHSSRVDSAKRTIRMLCRVELQQLLRSRLAYYIVKRK